VEALVSDLLAEMTLAEKVDQMHGVGLVPVDGLWHTAENERLGIPGLRMVDGPRGVGILAGTATAFPVGMARGATWDRELEERVGEAFGREVRAKGASVLLAPTINILRHPRWGRAQETYGEDPHHLGRMGVAFIRGVQRHAIASAKHFALNNIENTRYWVNVSVDERALREVYLPHFRMAVQDGHVGSVMSAYNRVNGHYCSGNFPLLGRILKGDWGFQGFVESDWFLGVWSTAKSARAGLDIEMPAGLFYGNRLLTAVQRGEVPEETIDEAARRILRVKYCFELDTSPPRPSPEDVATEEHAALALEVARKAIVLLKNDGALPLDREGIESLVVVGELADTANHGDEGSSSVAPPYVITPLEGIRNRAAGDVRVEYVVGNRLSGKDQDAIATAGAAVVVAGLSSEDEGEGIFPDSGDRAGLTLSAEHEQVITEVASLNPRTIVVLEGGSVITMETWLPLVEAVLMAWYPGQEGGNAIADVLFGEVNPSGRLPSTWPGSEADLPAFVNDRSQVEYGYDHGYLYVDREGIEPRYPFGYGLSYTTFDYRNLDLSDQAVPRDGVLRVGVDVTNTGGVDGEEVAQLYVSCEGSEVERPVKTLKGFEKVSLKPVETRRVFFDLAAADLAYYNVEVGAWDVEPISYTVHVGTSSRDLPLSAAFHVEPTEPQ
jgi:beta-glucosidase